MFIIVASYFDPLEAHIACGLLVSEDIDAHIVGEHLALANWEWRVAVGGIKLRVPIEQAERARAVLRATEAGEYTLDCESEQPQLQALRQSDHETWSSRLAWIALMLFNLPVPWRRREADDSVESREI